MVRCLHRGALSALPQHCKLSALERHSVQMSMQVCLKFFFFSTKKINLGKFSGMTWMCMQPVTAKQLMTHTVLHPFLSHIVHVLLRLGELSTNRYGDLNLAQWVVFVFTGRT